MTTQEASAPVSTPENGTTEEFPVEDVVDETTAEALADTADTPPAPRRAPSTPPPSPAPPSTNGARPARVTGAGVQLP